MLVPCLSSHKSDLVSLTPSPHKDGLCLFSLLLTWQDDQELQASRTEWKWFDHANWQKGLRVFQCRDPPVSVEAQDLAGSAPRWSPSRFCQISETTREGDWAEPWNRCSSGYSPLPVAAPLPPSSHPPPAPPLPPLLRCRPCLLITTSMAVAVDRMRQSR